MAYEQRPNTASLFNNKKKERDSHADLTGTLIIETQCPHCEKVSLFNFWANCWKRKDRNGATWLSMLFRAKEVKPPKEEEKESISIDDDIPF